MHSSLPLLFGIIAIASASPFERRTVAALNTAAFDEAQQKDNTATRAFSGTSIKTGDGRCLFIDELSGDFRANLNPIQVAACDGSAGQSWDVVTAGAHDNVAGTMLLVSTLTQACMNFDDRRAAGNQVIMFSCGGRADGGGTVTPSQLFNFTSGAGPLAFQPQSGANVCLAVTAANVLDQAPCAAGNATQSFSFGGEAPGAGATTSVAGGPTSPVAGATPTPTSALASSASITLATNTKVPVTASSASAPSGPSVSTAIGSAAQSASAVPVSRAGGVLQPSAAAEANPKDTTATLAFSSASIKTSSGQCLFIDSTAGDFRQNLIPIAVQDCTGAAGEKFDIITAGAHNNEANSTLVVSSLTEGCLNFDDRRAAGDQVIMFSCGGRADGGGAVTDSQLFPFGGGNSIELAPKNGAGATCLFANGAKLDQQACTGNASQTFDIFA
ncbi:hypothetical protein LHYA1_G001241 [Lachnellula hyalina]|uniref:Ricin B lectin domain-containing protein n=1 Tax=Lachnellula hyalina TaxID=1316788 RepID=A0A8H8R8W7_9HELO|nr:uncharacterized protein LHYA1_G001241 [Lachnellula hyalina]TVY30646.1 hypothetical protein LHYA1_G001241 [Lachnellula hyalina]